MPALQDHATSPYWWCVIVSRHDLLYTKNKTVPTSPFCLHPHLYCLVQQLCTADRPEYQMPR